MDLSPWFDRLGYDLLLNGDGFLTKALKGGILDLDVHGGVWHV